jgi:hypothetical protein
VAAKAEESYEKFKALEFERVKLQSEVQGLQKNCIEGVFKVVSESLR